MRIISLSDSHISERSSRSDECIRIHEWIVDTVRHEKPDVVLHPGDLVDGRTTARDRLYVASLIRRLAEVCPVVGVKGNHEPDAFELEIFGELKTVHPVHVIEDASVATLDVRGQKLAVAGLGWPSFGSNLDSSVARQDLRNVISGLGVLLDDSSACARVLLAHVMMSGSIMGSGQPITGGGLTLSVSELGLARAHVGILGHVHRSQGWEHNGVRYEYVGSPIRNDFGEAEEKSILDVRIENGHVDIRRIVTPCRAMHLIQAAWDPDSKTLSLDDEPSDFTGADVRLRYSVDVANRLEARASATALERRWLDDGAATVKRDEQIAVVVRARSPEVARAQTLRDAVLAHWKATGNEPGSTTAQRLLDVRLPELEVT